jgi:hypothetical protein
MGLALSLCHVLLQPPSFYPLILSDRKNELIQAIDFKVTGVGFRIVSHAEWTDCAYKITWVIAIRSRPCKLFF